nr:uncharacterized protein LOC122272568 [Parasteatoda tepidariorum]
MDLLIVKRKSVRASFTRLYNILIAALGKPELNFEDLESKLSSLRRISIDLSKLDEDSICNAILIEVAKADDFENEYCIIEEYREKLDSVRVRVKRILNSRELKDKKDNSVKNEKTKLKLPEIELVHFSGEVKDSLHFWSQFSRIHENKSMDDEDKFQYLIQCVTAGGRAREIVDSYPPTADNYCKVIESFKSRFGREELLIEYYVRELLTLVVKNATNLRNKMDITQLYDKLESHLRSLESIGMTSDKYAAMLFPLVESCIPEENLRVWLRSPLINKQENSYSDKLAQLLTFLRREVEGKERIALAKTGFKQAEIVERRQKHRETEFYPPTAKDLISGFKEKKKLNCIFCNKLHESKDCFKGQKLSLEEKREAVRKYKYCFFLFEARAFIEKLQINCTLHGLRKETLGNNVS